MSTLLLIDFQQEFFLPRGILSSHCVALHVAHIAARLIASWPSDRPIVCITSSYDRWKTEEPLPQFVESVHSDFDLPNKSDRLARAHRGRACCERADSELIALVPAIAEALSVRESEVPGSVHRIEKEYYSAFAQTGLEDLLRRVGASRAGFGGSDDVVVCAGHCN
jgi:nicotinamidase-related amidase